MLRKTHSTPEPDTFNSCWEYVVSVELEAQQDTKDTFDTLSSVLGAVADWITNPQVKAVRVFKKRR
jgi:hypothetical protein